jgi:hypothetical protein
MLGHPPAFSIDSLSLRTDAGRVVSSGPDNGGATRREFLAAAALGSATLATGRPTFASRAPAEQAPAPAVRAAGFFSEEERQALDVLAEEVLPGAASWGAVDYVEDLLTAFDHDPPRLHAGPANAGGEFLELDRVAQHAWRLRLYGSEAFPYANESVLGPVKGVRALLREGAQDAAERLRGKQPADWIWARQSDEFRTAFGELVLEGSLGDRIYGGNRDTAAWRAFHFEGALLGYGDYLGPVAGPDPEPLGFFTRAALWVTAFFARRVVD